MLLTEQGLARELKNAWKHGGYRIMQQDHALYILAPTWAAIIDADEVPRKIIGILAEHMGELPCEQGMHIKKKWDNQYIVPGEMELEFARLEDKPSAEAVAISLTWKTGWRLYQKPDHSIHGVDAGLLELLNHGGLKPPMITVDGHMACWQDDTTTVYICCMSRRDNVHLDYLEQFDWRISEEGETPDTLAESEDRLPEQFTWDDNTPGADETEG